MVEVMGWFSQGKLPLLPQCHLSNFLRRVESDQGVGGRFTIGSVKWDLINVVSSGGQHSCQVVICWMPLQGISALPSFLAATMLGSQLHGSSQSMGNDVTTGHA